MPPETQEDSREGSQYGANPEIEIRIWKRAQNPHHTPGDQLSAGQNQENAPSRPQLSCNLPRLLEGLKIAKTGKSHRRGA